MPIISKVNARSWKGKTLYVTIFVVLIAGAATMIYPFLLMLSGSIRSDVDGNELTIIPRFWSDDGILYQKYVESKYANAAILQRAWGDRPGGWRKIKPQENSGSRYLEEFLAWRPEAPHWELGHHLSGQLLSINARLYRSDLYDRFDGDLDRYKETIKIPVKDWNQVQPPGPSIVRFLRADTEYYRDWFEFAKSRPVEDRYIVDADAEYVGDYLMGVYTPSIEKYNELHGSSYESYDDVVLADRVPETAGLERDDWEYYVRSELRLGFIRLDPTLADSFRSFLNNELYATIDEFNLRFKTDHTAFSEIPFAERAPTNRILQADWEKFLKNAQACPPEMITIQGSRQLFEDFIAKRKGVSRAQISPVRIPSQLADYHDLIAKRKFWRSELTKRNYKQVFEYILRHGNGIKNTIIYCFLAIATALFVNPLAAYALSRYKPPSMYKILLFCMATMAFPGEVTMIPAFLLLKRFPAVPLIAGLVVFLVAIWILNRAARQWPEMLRLTFALVLAILAGAWAIPALTGNSHVSLLNTFWALVLPGAANGFFIFLLKGFFDSLPQELFEQAEIDGAGEWTKFWTITMNLSQPILAVIALNAFVGAYSAFMMALIIIPDQDMWTLMVWIFQLQSSAHGSVLYASLVITAIPTFLVFAFCQNIIIRGIVVPVEK